MREVQERIADWVDRWFLLTVIAILGVAVIAVGVAYAAKADDTTQTANCPGGQVVAVHVKAKDGSLTVEQGPKLPRGLSYEARGGGTSVNSDNHSATVTGNGPLELSVVCR